MRNQSESVLGKTSLIAGLSNVLLLALSLAAGNYSQVLGGIFLLAFTISLAIGIGAGIAAFLNKRAWLGLVINILMLFFLGASFYLYFTLCCAPVVQVK